MVAGAVTGAAELSDDDLAVQAQRHPDTFGQLYERYAREIEGFILPRVGGNRELAQDLTSQVFTKAFTALPRYQTGAFRGWLYQIARNTIIDSHRRARPTAPLDDATAIETHDQRLDDRVIAAEAAARLHRALDQLKPDQRRIILLRLQGLSGSEIASRLGLHPDAVKSAQYRAFAKLRTMLHDLAPDRQDTR